MKRLRFGLLAAGAAAIAVGSGCSVVNPYRSDWKCPPLENGKCVDVPEAYREALDKEREDPTLSSDRHSDSSVSGSEAKTGAPGSTPADSTSPSRSSTRERVPTPAEVYRDSVYRRLSALAKEPRTPLLSPPGVWRIWFLPYEEKEGEVLFGDRHVYVVLERPRFLLGEPLDMGGEGAK